MPDVLKQCSGLIFKSQKVQEKKKRTPSSILHEAKIAYYARNMFEAARFFVL